MKFGVQLLQFPYVPGICDEIPFPLAERVAELSFPRVKCSFSRHLLPIRLRFSLRSFIVGKSILFRDGGAYFEVGGLKTSEGGLGASSPRKF